MEVILKNQQFLTSLWFPLKILGNFCVSMCVPRECISLRVVSDLDNPSQHRSIWLAITTLVPTDLIASAYEVEKSGVHRLPQMTPLSNIPCR